MARRVSAGRARTIPSRARGTGSRARPSAAFDQHDDATVDVASGAFVQTRESEGPALEATGLPLGNRAVAAVAARLVQRDTTQVPPVVRRTTRERLDDVCETVYAACNIGGLSNSEEEEILHQMLLNYDRAAELRQTYQSTYHRTLDSELAKLTEVNELRAREYLLVGRLRPITKVMIAMRGLGTAEGTLWRVLPEAAPTAVGDWDRLKADHPGVRTINEFPGSLYEALDGDLDFSDLDRAWALARFGDLRPEDKIRVATNQTGTDLPMLWDGLRSASPAAIAASYEAAYQENLETLLFDQIDDEGNTTSHGELSGHDAEYARSLLGTGRAEPDRLVNLARQIVSGMNDFSLLLSAVRDDTPTAEQLRRLKTAVEGDTLGFNDIGGLASGELAQLRAILGIRETSTDVAGGSQYMDVDTLNDPKVVSLRAKGGVDYSSVYDTLLKYSHDEIEATRSAFGDVSSPFNRYISNNTVVDERYNKLPIVFNGSTYAKLRMCVGGLSDDNEEYAVHVVREFASPTEKAQLAEAFGALSAGTTPTGPAAATATAVWHAFSTGEVNRLLDQCDHRPLGILDQAATLEERAGRERSDLFDVASDASSDRAALDDERRELRTGIQSSLLDGELSGAEERRLRGSATRVSDAIGAYSAARDEFAGYASMAVNLAIGLLIAAGTGGAAGPAVVAALMRSAAAMAVARVVTEKAIRGDHFDVMGADGMRAFIAGAADGVMNVVGAGAAAGILERVGVEGARHAIESGSATLGLRLVNESLSGGLGGGVGGVVDSVTNEATWANGVTSGVRTTLTAAASNAVQGAGTSAVITLGSAGLTAAGRRGGHGEGEGHGGAHGDASATGADGTTTRSGGAHGSGETGPRLNPTDPVVARALVDDGACADIVRRMGVWEHGIAALRSKTGFAADLSDAQALALLGALQRHRERLVAHLTEHFHAEPAAGASRNPESDMDLNVRGDNAGEGLINAREFLDTHYPGWQRNYRMALMIGAERITSISAVLAELPAGEQAAIRTSLSREVEALTISRRLRSIHDPAERAALLSGLDETNRAMAEGFSMMSDPVRQARHDAALLEGDTAARNFRAATTPEERLRWAREVTRQQMIANAMGADAYVSVASVEAFVNTRNPTEVRAALRRLDPHGQYDVLVDQVDMIAHQIHESGGVVPALRRYEVYKYIERFCSTLEASGLEDPHLAYFKNLADLHYRVDRGASAETRGPMAASDVSGGAPDAQVRIRDAYRTRRSVDGPSDQFLLNFWNEFRPWADAQSAAMHTRAASPDATPSSAGPGPAAPPTPAPAPAPGADAAPARPVSPLPAATADDVALATRAATPDDASAGPDAARPDEPALDLATTRTASPGSPTTELPGATMHRPLPGVAFDGPAAALYALDRLRRGDRAVLRHIGFEPPADFNPAAREWGVGQRSDGTCVLIYGDASEVQWAEMMRGDPSQRIAPLAHSHPAVAGRQIVEGRSVGDLIAAGGNDMIHVLPSAEDILFTQQRGLDHHDVYTPYPVDPTGKVYNPGSPEAGSHPALTFRIADPQLVGMVGDEGRRLVSALLIATDMNGNVHWSGRIYADSLARGTLWGTSYPRDLNLRPVASGGSTAAAADDGTGSGGGRGGH